MLSNKKLVVLYGPPCSGKSLFADLLIKEYSYNYISTDLLRINYFEELSELYDKNRIPVIYDMLFEKIEKSMSTEKSIIIEGMFLSDKNKLKILAFYNSFSISFVYITASYDILLERLKQRSQFHEDNILQKEVPLTSKELKKFYEASCYPRKRELVIDTSFQNIEQSFQKLKIIISKDYSLKYFQKNIVNETDIIK